MTTQANATAIFHKAPIVLQYGDTIQHKDNGAIAIVKALHANDVEAVVTKPGNSCYFKGDKVVWRLTDVESVEII